MVDPQHGHKPGRLVDRVHDPVRPAPGRPGSRELAPQWLADTARFTQQVAEQELDDGHGCSGGEAIQAALRRRRDKQPIVGQLPAFR